MDNQDWAIVGCDREPPQRAYNGCRGGESGTWHTVSSQSSRVRGRPGASTAPGVPGCPPLRSHSQPPRDGTSARDSSAATELSRKGVTFSQNSSAPVQLKMQTGLACSFPFSHAIRSAQLMSCRSDMSTRAPYNAYHPVLCFCHCYGPKRSIPQRFL